VGLEGGGVGEALDVDAEEGLGDEEEEEMSARAAWTAAERVLTATRGARGVMALRKGRREGVS